MLFVLFTFSRKDDLSQSVAMGNVCIVDRIVVYNLREGNLDKFGYLATSLFVWSRIITSMTMSVI